MEKETENIARKLQELVFLDIESALQLYRERIIIFPNIMSYTFDFNKDSWLALYQKIENSSNSDILDSADETYLINLKVFLMWETKKQTAAEELATEVQKKNPDNLVALTNLAFIHLYNENINKLTEVLDHLEKLQKRKDFAKLEAEGKSNVCYCLSRSSSFKSYNIALKILKEISDVCPNKYKNLFSIALLHYRMDKKSLDKDEKIKNTKEAFQCLEKIRQAYPHNVNKTLMARTLTLLGLFKMTRWLFHEKSSQPKPYFQQALHISSNDRFVLEKTAEFYRINHNFEISQKLFQKAIEINETSYSHHHLGLLYIKKSNPNSYFKKKPNFSNEENLIGRLLKCPEDFLVFKRDTFIDKAEYHYEQSLKIGPANSAVVYDLLLLYISLKEYKNAMKYSEKYKPDNEVDFVKFYIVLGKLYYLQADEENNDEIKEELKVDGADMFLTAVNAAIEFLPFQERLKDIWQIKKMMTNIYENGCQEYNSHLLEIIQSVEQLPDGELYDKLLQKCEKSEFSRKIKKFCKNKEYVKANMYLKLTDKPHEIHIKLKKEIYMNLAKHFLSKQIKFSKMYFRKCYDLYHCYKSESSNELMPEHSNNDNIINFLYDIYIVTSPNSEELANSIGNNLEKYFGLRTTFGNEDYILGKLKNENLHRILLNSCNIGILLEKSNNMSEEYLKHTKYAKQAMAERQQEFGQLFIINNYENMDMPQHLKIFPQVKCKSGCIDDIENILNFLTNEG